MPRTSQPASLSKDQEIASLAKYAGSLPEASYLRPWLTSILPFVASDIRSDIFPTSTPAQTREFAEEIIAKANKEAESIRASAQREAERIIAAATAQANRKEQVADEYEEGVKQRLRDDISRLQSTLNRLSLP